MTGGRAGYAFTADEVRRLSGDPDLPAAASGLELSDRTLLADLTRLRRTVGELAPAVAETVRLRRRAVPKFGPAAAGWLLTEESLQQGSPAPVAVHRAGRLGGLGVHDLTCSIGADLTVLAGRGTAVGSDLDPVRVLMAAHNLGASGVPGRVFIADALSRSTSGLLGYADPARREGGRRITGVDTLPSVADLDRVHADRLPVLRLPPGIDFDALARPGEVEIVSLDGSARESVLWPPELAVVSRRATVLRTDGPTEVLTSDDPSDSAVLSVGEYLVDPDPAVVRSGLVRHWAVRHGLSQIDPHLAYLTGPAVPPWTRGFRVLEVAEYRERTVRDWLRRDGVGTLEIKQRGTPVVPDDLRRTLRPAMSRDTRVARTLVVARVGRGQLAVWCEAVDPVRG
ncbi:class I SAM-dependent methyltransferase [Nakamurella sp. YIM 132087]|uniref:Class I SAM-dependent methyltransferase n=1 Tax=Nakamurella alba TaxID=2665158 RepID=A0A7K1FRG4_9ACTN|nr:class I SAM-dependent methyltransferase [Nakamurella alba]MTD16726.1 class I SAM-dependent methyltransferase [Nakamurella alba]